MDKRFTTVGGLIRTYSILLVALPILISSLVFLLYQRNVLVAAKSDEIRSGLAAQAAAIDKWMQDRLAGAVFLASLPQVRQGDMAAARPIIDAFMVADQDCTGVVAVGADGRTILDTIAPVGLNLADRAYFAAGKEGRTFISDVLIGRASGKPIIIFSAPVTRPDGSFGGVVFLPVRMATVSNLLSRKSLGLEGGTFLVNDKGELLTEAPQGGVDSSVPSGAAMFSVVSGGLMDAYRAGLQPGGVYAGASGAGVVGGWVGLNVKPWILAGEMPEHEVVGGALSAFGVALAAAVVSILIFTPLLVRLANSIQKPIQQLVEFSESMKSGKYDTGCLADAPSGSPTEVTRLYDSFCTLGETIRETITTLETTSITDQLTGAYNRRFLMQEGERLSALAERGEQPLSVLMFDLDNFKRLNDTYGHQAGDAVLVAFAGLVGETVRGSDLFARVGGEEFCVVAPGADEEQATLLAERIRRGVERLSVVWEGSALPCSVSVGVAALCPAETVSPGRTSLECTLGLADKALYEAKRLGRNRVVAASRLERA